MSTLSTQAGCDGSKADAAVAIPLTIVETGHRPRGSIRASRSGMRRAAVLIALNALMVLHVIQWWLTGRTVSPIEPSETMYFLNEGRLNAGFVFFSLALLSTLVLGRWVCGWGCHLVALQDLCGWTMKKLGIRPRPFRARLLGYVPLLAALYMFVWPSVYRLFLPPPHNRFPAVQNHLMTRHFWDTFPPWYVAVPFLLLCGFATVYFLGAKGYCAYACPYGGFFGALDRAALGRIRVTDACTHCGHCTAVCTSNVRVHQEVHDFGMVVDPGCMKCLDCVSVCPNDALYFGFGRPQFLAAPRVEHAAAPVRGLTWAEELISVGAFAAAFLATRGVYDMVPFLMALGWAGVVAFLAVQLWRLAARPGVPFHQWQLKLSGRLLPAGAAFVAGAAAVMALTAHCGVIRYWETAGDRAFLRVSMPETAVLDGADLTPFLTPAVRAALDESSAYYDRCDAWGLLPGGTTAARQGWLNLIAGRREESARRFDQARRLAGRSAQGNLALVLGSVQMQLGRDSEAADSLRLATREEPALVAAWMRLGELCARTGRMNDAVAAWNQAVTVDPSLAAAHHNLAGALRVQGRTVDAARSYRRALELKPDDAETHFFLGVTLTELNQDMEAGRHFARAVELDPRFKDLLEEAPQSPQPR